MSRACDICQRGTQSSVSRSHSNIATKRSKYLNVQKQVVDGKKLKICSNCQKTLTKKQAKT
ncbi:50S ribosomal protein L28 [Patescibacteria group bacterium]|nr:50S ribosomal protein L28 [Patescibacteria group bacterium]MBU1890322.1 50S ribosomal protein L28 [Patescibacteria group bacterium]